MPISITAPRAAAHQPRTTQKAATYDDSDSDSDAGGVDLEGDVSMSAPASRARLNGRHQIVTPGEVITDDPQWMRGHGTYVSSEDAAIVSSVAGTVTRTNKLLSVRPLRARYTPEIGDLVVGRIVEVQAKRWRVDVGAGQHASLQISAINLPGGILRKRTDTDELQIRTFFAEGDLVVAEIQSLHEQGGASLHTRSLRYGKLRNGVFLAVSGIGGGGGGVVRAKRQTWTMEAANGAGPVEVTLGVNGYIWISKHVEGTGEAASSVGLNRMEEAVSANVYSSQNDRIEPETMREISRIRGVIMALVEHGLRVDEDMVTEGYRAAVDIGRETMEDDIFLGGEKGQRMAAALIAREDE
ncbi:exosome complex exonuclease RRP4 [Plectosphaerella plurivora]|uniref:Exosome complex exonuclease RRP4 n=1 Tax=Plectosphaerella plurivora TaxID=936078 RepID=A0A9P8VHL3_9PEZI|nr:exosome complex exonuclease RRP4 [Plectosphaerella plurivora]